MKTRVNVSVEVGLRDAASANHLNMSALLEKAIHDAIAPHLNAVSLQAAKQPKRYWVCSNPACRQRIEFQVPTVPARCPFCRGEYFD